MDLDIAEETAAYLVENGYGKDVLSKYTTEELEMITGYGSFSLGCEAIATMSSDDPALKEYLKDLQHFDNSVQDEIESRQ